MLIQILIYQLTYYFDSNTDMQFVIPLCTSVDMSVGTSVDVIIWCVNLVYGVMTYKVRWCGIPLYVITLYIKFTHQMMTSTMMSGDVGYLCTSLLHISSLHIKWWHQLWCQVMWDTFVRYYSIYQVYTSNDDINYDVRWCGIPLYVITPYKGNGIPHHLTSYFFFVSHQNRMSTSFDL